MNEAWRSEYPFRSQFLSLDDGRGGSVRMHYLDEGPEPKSAIGPVERPVLLCVHGNPTWSFYWRRLVSAFRDRYRVVVPDHVGCGPSDKPQSYEYRLARHIANVRELIQRLDLRNVVLLAHDWGGAIGLGAAGLDPERFAGFVLFNTGAFHGQKCPLRIRVCRTPVLGPLGVRGLNLFARAALVMATEKPERFTAAVRAGYLAPYDSWRHRVAVQRFVEDIPLQESHPSYATLGEVERNLANLAEHPKMFVWGMRDWCFTPKFLDRFLDIFPRAEVHRLQDCGHYVVEDAHERIVPLVERFLASIASPHTTSSQELRR